ncbi:MAG: UDP-N-acetylglucosamine 2-epimerase (non-hydrolyzing) [Saprospiraceae bacterium]|nr:UDP-N-acetylglucosamine 2-epimerase (non-hydrolyzing) [Saprospiraceae bacterium]
MKITIVAGTRPNFIKVAAIIKEAERRIMMGQSWFKIRFVHTGQHYDTKLSEAIFKDLQLPDPDINLMAGSGTHAEQTAGIMIKFEKELQKNRPDLVMVFGDVNSTMACAITAKKLQIPVAHVESGLRSRDMSMPEEINRILTDSITDLHFTTSESASANLLKEGKSPETVFFVGNTMIDTLKVNIDKMNPKRGYSSNPYLLLTLHRASNVDDTAILRQIILNISSAAFPWKIIFPIHPRLKSDFSDAELPANLQIMQAQSYLDFLMLLLNCKGVITDSGGISEECTMLNKPCISLRNTTERPETIEMGTNVLSDGSQASLSALIDRMKNENWKQTKIPRLWDGNAANRIWDILYTIHAKSGF